MAAATQSESGSFSAALTPAERRRRTAPRRAFSLGDVTWQSPEAIAAMVPAGIPAGAYDVVVTDPRGDHAQLACGFLSLGPDTQAPTVSIESPVARSLDRGGNQGHRRARRR